MSARTTPRQMCTRVFGSEPVPWWLHFRIFWTNWETLYSHAFFKRKITGLLRRSPPKWRVLWSSLLRGLRATKRKRIMTVRSIIYSKGWNRITQRTSNKGKKLPNSPWACCMRHWDVTKNNRMRIKILQRSIYNLFRNYRQALTINHFLTRSLFFYSNSEYWRVSKDQMSISRL